MPAGTPMPSASSVAVPETWSDSQRIPQISRSAPTSRAIAWRRPLHSRSMARRVYENHLGRITHGSERHPARQPDHARRIRSEGRADRSRFHRPRQRAQAREAERGEGQGRDPEFRPSLDTPTCDTETRRFNQEAAKLGDGVEIWTISRDLPFAQKRWCGAAGVTAVKTLSDFRDRAFGPAYGVEIKDGPIAGLTARAVFVVGRDGKVTHVEYVKEIGSSRTTTRRSPRRSRPRAERPRPRSIGTPWLAAASRSRSLGSSLEDHRQGFGEATLGGRHRLNRRRRPIATVIV